MGSGFLFENRLIMMLWLRGAQLLCMHAGVHVVSPGGGGAKLRVGAAYACVLDWCEWTYYSVILNSCKHMMLIPVMFEGTTL